MLVGRSRAGGAAVACEALIAAVWLAGRGSGAAPPPREANGAAGTHEGPDGTAGGTRLRRRLTVGLALLGMALAASQLPRLVRIAARRDTAALARAVCIAWGGTAGVAVSAPPRALAAAAGAALAGGAGAASPAVVGWPRRRPAGNGDPSRIAGTGPRPAPAWLNGPACVYGLAAAAALLAPQMARWHYDRAVAAGQSGNHPAALSELTTAVRLDPAFPLYRLRLAPPRGCGAGASGATAPAWRAARAGRGGGIAWPAPGIPRPGDGGVCAAAARQAGRA